MEKKAIAKHFFFTENKAIAKSYILWKTKSWESHMKQCLDLKNHLYPVEYYMESWQLRHVKLLNMEGNTRKISWCKLQLSAKTSSQ